MPDFSEIEVGQTVELVDGQTGVVHFAGSTQFAPGEWIGLVFEDPVGKNDGSVKGQRYFDCRPGHGMFVKPTAVATVIERSTQEAARRATEKVNGTATKSRMSTAGTSGLKKNVADSAASKRQSINAPSPTPASRVSRLAGSSQSPTKQLGSNASSATSTPRTNTPTSTTRKSVVPAGSRNRTSMGPPPPPSASTKRPVRSSIGPTTNGSAKPPAQSSVPKGLNSRLSTLPGNRERLRSTSGESRSSQKSGRPSSIATSEGQGHAHPEVQDAQEDTASEAAPATVQPTKADEALGERLIPGRGRSPVVGAQRSTESFDLVKKENERLAAELRVTERRSAEDREKAKDLSKKLDRACEERDRYEAIIKKIQEKYQPQQHELNDLRGRMKTAEAQIESLEAQKAEHESLNEMATLDKEMAEEMAESVKIELHALRQRHEEIELEIEVLREENQELGKEISPEEKTSQGWLQLEKSNERYREALLRLRDVTQDKEAELRAQIDDLEQDLQDYTKIKEEATSTKDRLLLSESNLEDVRQQLDTALGAEDMIEELTQRNLTLSEKMDELRTTIEELESLKELNDELEINHVETEKQLQDEIDYQDSLLQEEARRAAVQDGNVQDLEYTISRFRDLVTNLQSDLEDMKASQQISESQANELNLRSRAMEDLNLKLQSSAAKAQTKAIDIELNKLRAQESAEHLGIVQMFLPESFKSENDSVQALLRYRRMEFKTEMLHNFIKERITDNLALEREGDIVKFSIIMDKLMWVSSTSNRFSKTLETCEVDTFKRLGAASFDLEPVERAIDRWILAFKQDDLKTDQCISDLTSFIAMMRHLAEVHIADTLDHHADLVIHTNRMIQSQLETTAILLSRTKSLLQSSEDDFELDTADEEDDLQTSLSRLDAVLSQVRSTKVVSGKAMRQIEDLKSRQITLDPSTFPTVEQSERLTAELLGQVDEVGRRLFENPQPNGDGQSSRRSHFSAALEDGQVSLATVSSKSQAAASQLHAFCNLTMSLAQAVEFAPTSTLPPWRLLAQEMHAATADNNAREARLIQLKDEVSEKNTALAMKEKAAEELNVKLEVLEKRNQESGGHKERVKELEDNNKAAKTKERDLISKLNHLKSEYQLLEADRDNLKELSKKAVSPNRTGQATTVQSIESNVTSETSRRRIEALQAEIKVLQSSIRYLQGLAHARTSNDSVNFLANPITPPLPPVPPVRSEAQDVLKEMLGLLDQPASQLVALSQRDEQDRRRWKPVKETAAWQVHRQKEGWEEWREWRNDIAKRAARSRREKRTIAEAMATKSLKEGNPLARLQLQMPLKSALTGDVRIVNPEEWEDIEKTLNAGGG